MFVVYYIIIMKIKRLLRNKTLLASVATIVVLAGAGVSYGVVQNKSAVHSDITPPTSEQVVSPSPSPVATIDSTPAPTTSTSPSPSSSPQPTATPPAPTQTDDVLRYYGVADADIQFAKTMTLSSGWHYSAMKITTDCTASYVTVVKCFTDYAVSTYGSWSAAVTQFKTAHKW